MLSKKFLFLLLVLAVLQNQSKIKRWLNPPPPREPGTYSLVMYSTTWCGYCAQMRRYFADYNLQYRDVDVENTDEGKQAYQALGADGVPIVVVNGKTVIKGYAPDEVEQALSAN